MTKRRRGQLVTFERATIAPDDFGQEVPTWATICQEEALIFYGRGDERRQAAMEEASQAATFQVPSNSDTRGVEATDRISFDGTAWDIQGKALDYPDRRWVEFTAVRAA